MSLDFRALFESLPGLYLILDEHLTVVAVSDAYLRATMTERHSILGRHVFEVFPDNPDDPHADGVRNLAESLQRVKDRKLPDAMAVQKYDVRRPAALGGAFEERHWSPLNTPIVAADGSLRYIIHRVEDVTDFVLLSRREAELASVADRLRTRSGQMELEIVRRSQELHDANRELRLVQEDLERRVAARTEELAHSNDALRREMEQSRRLEEQVRQAQKMEAIGTLAGGIAHDFNNLLTVICGCTELLLESESTPHDARELLDQVYQAGTRAARLTGQLLAFSRQTVLAPRLLDINAIVADVDKMLQRLIGEDISFTSVLQPDLRAVLIDPGQVEQLLMNLAVNARDAMPQGGQLTIETASVTLGRDYADDHVDVVPGDYVMLAVSDTGIGMDADTQRRIFEPFFTTKEPGKGTGLGLASVFGIVKQSGGHVWVYSEPGHGTTFKIFLPAASAPAEAGVPSESDRAPTGSETLLVAEDEADVRAWTTLALRSLGYDVLEARNGAEAISVSAAHDGPIDLLISDVVMPGMGGRLAADAIAATRPGLKVLFLSGYTDDAVVRHGILAQEVAFLQKPFSRLALARRVREVLSRA